MKECNVEIIQNDQKYKGLTFIQGMPCIRNMVILQERMIIEMDTAFYELNNSETQMGKKLFIKKLEVYIEMPPRNEAFEGKKK